MENVKTEKVKGWEIAAQVEATKGTIWERLIPEAGMLKAMVWGVVVFFGLFLVGIWLAGNPFEATVRMQSKFVVDHGLTGNQWSIIWSVVLIAAFFEFMDASAGMGFGTALTPLLLVMGFDPKQIVPVVMIQQGAAGLVGTFLHREFENVEWKFSPMSETIKLAIIIAGTGVLFNTLSVVGVYKIFNSWKSMDPVIRGGPVARDGRGFAAPVQRRSVPTSPGKWCFGRPWPDSTRAWAAAATGRW